MWQQRLGASLGENGDTKSMLVLDALRGHPTPEVKTELGTINCDLVVVPGAITSDCSPFDVSVNKPFKEHMRQEYEKWIRCPEQKKTPMGRLHKASPATIAPWSSGAWKRVRAEVVENSFKKCCITNRRDGILRTICCGIPRTTGAAARVEAPRTPCQQQATANDRPWCTVCTALKADESSPVLFLFYSEQFSFEFLSIKITSSTQIS